MNKIDEIKQALKASKLGHWHKAEFDTNAPEHIAYLLKELEEKEREVEQWRKHCQVAVKLMQQKFYGYATKSLVEALGQEGEGNQDA